MRKTVLLLTSVMVALLLASGVGLLNTLTPAKATFAGQNGKIAYAHDSGLPRDFPDDYEIYTIDATGAAPSNVTNNDTYDYMPSYSPDGTRIAYECWDGADSEICTIDARGGTPFQVTNNDTPDSTPSYSPDGTRIAYGGSDGRDFEIYTIAATGGTSVQITDNNTEDFEPDYSPDGTRIAFTGEDITNFEVYGFADYEIYTIAATGGTPFNVTNNNTHDDHASYSPDGTRIAYSGEDATPPTADSEIYTIDATGGTPFNVTDNNWTDSEPSYSPDGTKLAYAVYKDGPDDVSRDLDSEIYSINATGGTPVRITHNSSEDRHPSWGVVRSSSSN